MRDLAIRSTAKLATFQSPPIDDLKRLPARAEVTKDTVSRSATPISSKAAAPILLQSLSGEDSNKLAAALNAISTSPRRMAFCSKLMAIQGETLRGIGGESL
ncbi:hypothetical protein A4A58_04650 [Tardiphaga robiniae]|uniref:Uncharacterized protein n=1 Tax=Tardiphaga robiniae TaxID=943830 RepID=A0A164B323_9BRAD|nr:hypothetical protein A4A58_04650 [Tardiphaga robiniae]